MFSDLSLKAGGMKNYSENLESVLERLKRKSGSLKKKEVDFVEKVIFSCDFAKTSSNKELTRKAFEMLKCFSEEKRLGPLKEKIKSVARSLASKRLKDIPFDAFGEIFSFVGGEDVLNLKTIEMMAKMVEADPRLRKETNHYLGLVKHLDLCFLRFPKTFRMLKTLRKDLPKSKRTHLKKWALRFFQKKLRNRQDVEQQEFLERLQICIGLVLQGGGNNIKRLTLASNALRNLPWGDDLSKEALEMLTKAFPHLKHLYIGPMYKTLVFLDDDAFDLLKKFKELEILNIGNVFFNGKIDIVTHLKDFKALKILRLRGQRGQISVEFLKNLTEEIKNFVALETLDLRGCVITDEVRGYLEKMKKERPSLTIITKGSPVQ